MKVTMIDPPSGHLYGFPKVFDKPDNVSLEEWLIENGYPDFDTPWALKYCRYWEQEVEDDT